MTDMDLFGIKKLKDLKYRARIAALCENGTLVCLVCGMPAVGHHVRNKQVYGDRKNIVPLCEGFVTGHHTRAQFSVHQMGRTSFERKFKHQIPNGLQWEAERIDEMDQEINGGESFK